MRRRRTLLLFAALTATAHAALPDAVTRAIAGFRADGAKGWAYTQTTVTAGKRTIERFDPGRPILTRWTLLERDGRAPTAAELQQYRERKALRVTDSGPPLIKDQLELAGGRLLQETAQFWRYQFPLKRAGDRDTAAPHLRATLTIDKAAAAVAAFELNNAEAFSPAFLVRVQRMRTLMTYSLPTPAEPSHLLKVEASVRGRAIFKSLDQDVVVTYADFAPARVQSE